MLLSRALEFADHSQQFELRRGYIVQSNSPSATARSEDATRASATPKRLLL